MEARRLRFCCAALAAPALCIHTVILLKVACSHSHFFCSTVFVSYCAVCSTGVQEANPEAYSKLDMQRVGVLVGTGMGGLTVFQDGECCVCVCVCARFVCGCGGGGGCVRACMRACVCVCVSMHAHLHQQPW